MPNPEFLAPGARVVIRDAEWMIRRIDSASDGGLHLVCDGVSDLVRGRSAHFLTALEDSIEVLDPARTELVVDSSPRFVASLLSIEAQLRRTTPNDDRLHCGHLGAMDLVEYQLEPALQALAQPRQRILIADAVGLGKTLEAGILVTELIQRGRGQRILVVTLKSMLTQFQKEFWSRFTIPLVRLDSIGLARVRSRIPTNHNPFNYYDKTIISIDTLKGDLEYRNYLENAWWDIIVIDEAQNVADRGTSSQRARLAKLLARRSDTLIMLSATPHDGRARSFASLVNMLDPTAIADPDDYVADDFRGKGLVIRRFKKDIQHQVRAAFQDRVTISLRHTASEEEEAAYEALLAIHCTVSGRHEVGPRNELVRVGLQKALFSSPAAARQSVAARLNGLRREATNAAIDAEIDALERFDAALACITPERHANYQRLLDMLAKDSSHGWSPASAEDRLVIFSERLETLAFLAQHLRTDLHLPERAIATLHGGLSDIEQQRLVEEFGKVSSPLRLLLCSDVASEGLNLHYLCHRLVHFDLPWSLMLFQQRNGRVDRYGQKDQPHITYLVTESGNERIRGDQRILDVLQVKDEQAYRNIGDPSVFMHVHDPDAEVRITEEAMASGMTAPAFDAKYQPRPDEGEDLLAQFLAVMNEPAPGAPVRTPQDSIAVSPGLFAGDYTYCKAALEYLSRSGSIAQWQAHDAERRIALTAPPDLAARLRQVPREAIPELQQFVLTDDKAQVMAEMERSRREAGDSEETWPRIQYLWKQHPVVQWLTDRVQASFGRHKAPVVLFPKLGPEEALVVISGLVPNRRGQPIVYEWLAVLFSSGQLAGIEPFVEFVKASGIGITPLTNPGKAIDTTALQLLVPSAVAAARDELLRIRAHFESTMSVKLAAQRCELGRLRQRQFDQVERRLASSAQAQAFKHALRARRAKEINEVFDAFTVWVEDTMTTEPLPYLQVVAMFAGAGASR